MPPVLLLLLPALVDLSDPPPTDTPAPPPTLERRARWLPRVTFRFTRRSVNDWWAISQAEALSTPLGTTFEVILDWGSAGFSLDR